MSEPQKKCRVGIVGLNSVGRFLLERLSLIPDCEIVLFQSPPDSQAQSLHLPSITDWKGFLSESSLNAVLFLDGGSLTVRQVEDAFQAGLPVGFLPPLALEPSEWRELAKDSSRNWRILNPHHEDPDFRAAMASIQSGELGPIKAIKRISWVGELVVSAGARAIALNEWLPQLLWEDMDQLLLLAGELPESIHTVIFSRETPAYEIVFEFPSGMTAHLERRRGMGLPLEVGWTIGSLKGGYASGHRHIKTAEGELYDVPVDLPPFSNDPLAPALENLAPSLGGKSAARHVLKLLEILNDME